MPEVGGKTASLGELYALLAADGGRVPDGFALTAAAYRDALTATGAWQELRKLLTDLDHHNVALLAERAAAARRLVYDATGNTQLPGKSPTPIGVSRGSAALAWPSPCAALRQPKTSLGVTADFYAQVDGLTRKLGKTLCARYLARRTQTGRLRNLSI